jgi:hypothetical protein
VTITSDASRDLDEVLTSSGATRFFWTWLIVATSVSVTGNVTHAVINASQQTVWIAAGAALVPPTVLLAAAHSVHVLVKSRTSGMTYWCALLMTVALAAFAFVLSFDALRALAIIAGINRELAWLWPCAIDVSIAQATLCLLSVTRPARASSAATAYTTQPDPAPAVQRPARRAGPHSGYKAHATVTEPTSAQTAAIDAPLTVSGSAVPMDRTDHTLAAVPDTANTLARAAVDPAALMRWKPIADVLVRDGVTSKDPDLVATILAQRAAGTPPGTIGRLLEVHHSTVGRILTAAESLAV